MNPIKQDAATIREYRAALEDGNLEQARRIRKANPDLLREFAKVAWEVAGKPSQWSEASAQSQAEWIARKDV